jgi:Mitochondrial carrier protein
MFDVEEDVNFDELDARKFFWLSTGYSFVDSVFTHPFFVATTVAELHKGARRSSSNALRPERFPYWLLKQNNGNLNFFQAVSVMTKAQTAPGLLPKFRAMYTGFPVAGWGFLFGDVTQMMAYNYFKTKIENMKQSNEYRFIGERTPSPLLAGFLSMSLCALPCNATMVLFRQQVYLRTRNMDYSFNNLAFNRLPNLEGGAVRSLLRGTIVSSVAQVPSVAISWQVYETTKKYVREVTGSSSVFTSVASGSITGIVDALVTRPVSVVTSRMHTDKHPRGFWSTARTLFKTEGGKAFYKGLGSQVLANIPRMGLFFSVYQTFVTLAKKPIVNTHALD